MSTPSTIVSTVNPSTTVVPPNPWPSPAPPPRATGLSLWVSAANEAQEIARVLVQSFFVPAAYKPNIPPRASEQEAREAVEVAVANATGAILLGQSLSTPAFEIDPLTALQNIYVVHGRPGMYAKFKVGLALAHGHAVRDIEYGPERVTVEGQRKGSDEVVRITVTIEDAQRAGWTSSDTYKRTPADMLWARAASRVVDRIASDALFGIASVEDLADGPAVTVEAAPARVTAESIIARTSPVEERVALTGTSTENPVRATVTPAAEEPAPAAPPMIDEKTWKAINRQWTALGVNGPGSVERRLAAVARMLGRPVANGSELTADEGDIILATLSGLKPEDAALADILGERVDEPPAEPDSDEDAPVVEEPPGWQE